MYSDCSFDLISWEKPSFWLATSLPGRAKCKKSCLGTWHYFHLCRCFAAGSFRGCGCCPKWRAASDPCSVKLELA
eukprot:1571531-Amphidinium_carterae.1